jgi:uncharacterized protein (DUF342 family)
MKKHWLPRKEPVDGKNAELVYNIDIEKPKQIVMDEAGRVNHREVKDYKKVDKGDILVTRTMPTEGERLRYTRQVVAARRART